MDAYLRDLDRPRPRSKAPAQVGPDLFTQSAVGSIEGGRGFRAASYPALRGGEVGQPSDLDSQQSRAFDKDEGVRRKEAALREFNERRGDVIRWVRRELAALSRATGAAVSADDAVKLLAVRLDCDEDDVPTGPWMGALFRSSEWEFSHWTVSERTSNNGRSLRAWRLK